MEFSTYIQHLQKIVPRSCRICKKTFCFACGEPLTVDPTKRSCDPAQDETLFHCSNLQGVILGVGLAMLEKVYIEQTQDVSNTSENKAKSAKRRKVDPVPIPIMQHDPDDDDDEDNYYPPVAQGKKAKLGVGYAGETREDVS